MALKILIVAVVAHISIALLIYPRPPAGRLVSVLPIMAVGGPLAFQIPMWFPGGLLGVLLGITAFWLVVVLTLDHFFDVHYDQSYAITGQIVGISVLIWLILGLTLNVLAAMRA